MTALAAFRPAARPTHELIVPLELTGLTKMFPDAVRAVCRGEERQRARSAVGVRLSFSGHSGCGKSTVLSIIAGLQQATEGGVVINGRQIDAPGADRAVVFQTPSLLPWLSARDNVRWRSSRSFGRSARAERRRMPTNIWSSSGVADSADQLPAELSLGTQQCVSLARALALEPEILLLDEPFSMLDSLTRLDLQDTLLAPGSRIGKIVVMVTHDVDEALYLADRLVLMTDGPEARVGEILTLPFPRPRDRHDVLEHPEYYGTGRASSTSWRITPGNRLFAQYAR